MSTRCRIRERVRSSSAKHLSHGLSALLLVLTFLLTIPTAKVGAAPISQGAGTPNNITLRGTVNVSALPPAMSSDARPEAVLDPPQSPTQANPVQEVPPPAQQRSLMLESSDQANPVRVSGDEPPPVPPLRLTSFPGIGYTGLTPPDTQIAVGPSQVLQMVNAMGRISSKSGTPLKSFDLSRLFIIDTIFPAITNPKTFYDLASQRFFASALFFSNCSGCDIAGSQVVLAVSHTSDPAGLWSIYTAQSNTNKIRYDQPKLGMSDDKVVISWNNDGSEDSSQYRVIHKQDLLDRVAVARSVIFGPEADRFNVVPAQPLSATKTAYAVYHNKNSNNVSVMAFTGTPAEGNIQLEIKEIGLDWATSSPPLAKQPGDPSLSINVGDDRVQSVIWKDNNLWATGGTGCETPVIACLYFVQIGTDGTPHRVQATTLSDRDKGDIYYPAITLDYEGNLWIGATVSSATSYPAASVRPAQEGRFPPLILRDRYAIGIGAYQCVGCGQRSWGSYSGIALDPSNWNDVWVAAEYGSTSTTDPGQWGTAIGRFTLAPPKVDSMSPTKGPELSTCAKTVTITGAEFPHKLTEVFFDSVRSSVSVLSTEELRVDVPLHSRGSVPVIVKTPKGSANAGTFTYDPDLLPPQTTPVIDPPPNANGWNNTDVTVALHAIDNMCGSGVRSVTYSATGAQPIDSTPEEGPFASKTINTDGITEFRYFATDNANNREAEHLLPIWRDTIAPQSRASIPEGLTPTIDRCAPLVIGATDERSGVQSIAYRFFPFGNSPPAYTITNTHILTFTLDSNIFTKYEIDIYATDKADNPSTVLTRTVQLGFTECKSKKAAYAFDEGSGTIIHDRSARGTPVDLQISDPLAAHWTPTGLAILSPTLLISTAPATKLTDAFSATNELTIEAWVRPAGAHQGTGTIVSLSPGPEQANLLATASDRHHDPGRNLALQQTISDSETGDYEARLRTTATSAAGKSLQTSKQLQITDLTHVVYARDSLGTARLYIDGTLQGQRTIAGNFTNWDRDAYLMLGNELGGDSPWLGEYRYLAFYEQAFSPAQVRQNFYAGFRGDGRRARIGLESLYTFKDGAGTVVHDRSGNGAPLDLSVGDPAAVRWTPDGLVISSTTQLASAGPATKIIDASRASNELTIETWVKPANTHQQSLARIATISNDAVRRNIELLQEREDGPQSSRFSVRLRTSETGGNGKPPLRTPKGSATIDLQHIVYTHDAHGLARIYVNGVEQAREVRPGDFSSWDESYRLVLANVATGDRPWLGEYQLVAFYDRALSPIEVRQNYRTGPADDRQPLITRLASLYTFDEGSGTTVHDVARGAALDLQIDNPAAVNWTPGGLIIAAPTILASTDSATKITDAVSATGELTLEAWVRPATATSDGPATILTLAQDLERDDVALVQKRADSQTAARYQVGLRTTRDSRESLQTRKGSLTTALTHVVYTRDALGVARIYVNGVLQAKDTIAGEFSNWDAGAQLLLANTLSGVQPWLGEYQLVAIYNRALSPTEISQRFMEGSGVAPTLR
jgi:hypothetical protein